MLLLLQFIEEMNWEKKTIDCYKYELNKGGCFISLWEIIAKSFQFYKIPIDISDKKYAEIKSKTNYWNSVWNIDFDNIIYDQIKNYYKEKNKNCYITDDFNNNLKIILFDKNHLILSNKSFEYGSIFATLDNLYSNRYFIGFQYHKMYTDNEICGMIVYFDSNGVMKKKNIFYNIPCTYDGRNGYIDSTKTILYNRTLMFYQIHRDSKNLTLFVNLLNWEDDIVETKTFYNTNITCSQFEEFKNITYEFLKKNNLNPRFFYVKTRNYNCNNSNEEKHIFLDLDSLDCVEKEEKNIFTNLFSGKKEKFIKLDYYVLNSLDDINNFISVSSKFEKKELVTDYPIFCPKCYKLTSKATHITKMKYGNSTLGLGDSFCFDCKIRYSKSENCWICCFLTTEIEKENDLCHTGICHSKLDNSNEYNCICKDKHTSKYKLSIKTTEESYIYPFKKTITLINEKI